MPKLILLSIALTVIILTAITTVFFNSGTEKNLSKNEIDTAVNQAQYLYRQKKLRNENLASGPCLSNALMPNWVVDIVHKPRLPIDDLPENQCPAYHEGRARHFVELDTEGDLVRVK